jgi:hypothetical protein
MAQIMDFPTSESLCVGIGMVGRGVGTVRSVCVVRDLGDQHLETMRHRFRQRTYTSPPSPAQKQTAANLITRLSKRILYHRLNMEMDLQSLFGPNVHSCTLPAFRLIYDGAISQPR